MPQDDFIVSFKAELTAEDRGALTSRRCKLYENAIGSTAAYASQPYPPMKWRHVVRLTASDGNEAYELVVAALGREPDDIAVFGSSSDD